MSSAKPPPPEPYEVCYSQHVRHELRALLQRAQARGHGKEYLEAAREIDWRLRIYPQFGEPLMDLTQQPGTIWHGTVGPLVVRYAIYEDLRLVVVATPIMDAQGSAS
jgi:hypothetical protein